MQAAMKSKKKRRGYTYAVGRRKTATARVRFYKSDEKEGDITVNETPLAEYFPSNETRLVELALKVIDAKVGGYFTVKVSGGGAHSQAQAVRHGIARALVQLNEDWKPALKQKGYMTRDPRMKERKKPGLKRARRAPQWSKR